MEKKLRRSNDKMIAGVCAGVAHYFDLDPTVIRIVYVLLSIFTAFAGVLVYLILWLIMPKEQA
ncbi:MAG: PspC domain-containing protein [Parabacteroides sp.]|nr:PspC domain-containing protein [Parabacteroides sp.]